MIVPLALRLTTVNGAPIQVAKPKEQQMDALLPSLAMFTAIKYPTEVAPSALLKMAADGVPKLLNVLILAKRVAFCCTLAPFVIVISIVNLAWMIPIANGAEIPKHVKLEPLVLAWLHIRALLTANILPHVELVVLLLVVDGATTINNALIL